MMRLYSFVHRCMSQTAPLANSDTDSFDIVLSSTCAGSHRSCVCRFVDGNLVTVTWSHKMNQFANRRAPAGIKRANFHAYCVPSRSRKKATVCVPSSSGQFVAIDMSSENTEAGVDVVSLI